MVTFGAAAWKKPRAVLRCHSACPSQDVPWSRGPAMHGPNLRSVNFGWTGLVVDALQHFQHGFVDLTSPCLHGAQASDMQLQPTAQYLSRASHTRVIRTLASRLISQLIGSTGIVKSVQYRYSHNSILHRQSCRSQTLNHRVEAPAVS